MKENKADFAKKFHKLISENTMEYSDIVDITYVKDEREEEWLYVSYKSNCQRRINVSASSCSAMMLDFLNNVNKAEWLPPDKRIPVPGMNVLHET